MLRYVNGSVCLVVFVCVVQCTRYVSCLLLVYNATTAVTAVKQMFQYSRSSAQSTR